MIRGRRKEEGQAIVSLMSMRRVRGADNRYSKSKAFIEDSDDEADARDDAEGGDGPDEDARSDGKMDVDESAGAEDQEAEPEAQWT